MSDSNESAASTPRSSITTRSSASIETTVTKLLMSTKHLLQILTQWSKGGASGKVVSDAYVQLGNDFKLVSKFFSHAKVDISDLGDVPMDLRRVLEVTLREPASDETLNRYLPRIREIIVNLLDKLKVKQAQLKTLRQERQSMKFRHSQAASISSNISTNSVTSPETERRISLNTSLAGADLNQEKQEEPTLSKVSSEENSPELSNKNLLAVPRPGTPIDQDALSQLKKGTNLQRRASKRYSAYHMAKLTNQSTTEAVAAAALASSPIANENSETFNEVPIANHAISNEQDMEGDNSESNLTAHGNEEKNYTLFLKYKNKTKKCTVPIVTSMNNLRLLFVEIFAYSPGGNTFPDIYIKDPVHSVFFELEESQICELSDGSVLELREYNVSKTDQPNFENFLTVMREEIKKSQDDLIEQIKLLKDNSGVSTIPVLHTSEKNVKNPGNDAKIQNLKRELASLKQIQKSGTSAMQQTLQNISEKLIKFQSLPTDVSGSSDRIYIDKSQTELGEVSDTLLSKVDDLQDVIEVLRKDVAERGSKPSVKKLGSLSAEIISAEHGLQRMQKFIDTEKPRWKKIWESELDKVCEEQQFLTLQEDLISDLKEDLNKASETFNLINRCCEEQAKNPSRSRANPVLPLLKPGTFNQVREQLMMAVESLTPDHESRVDALEKAQKMWEKEKEYRESDAFQSELGNFVGNSHLKKSGGIEEVERQRKQKDEENLRATFGGGF